MGDERRATAGAVAGGLVVIYVLWGSTYLGGKFLVETIPPFLASGSRFALCGAGLFAFAYVHQNARPTRTQWRNAAIAGALLFVGGNGGVVFAQADGVPSGIAALVVATVPAWLVLFDWAAVTGRRPGPLEPAWVGLGLTGVGVLVGAGAAAGGLHPFGGTVIVIASASWAAGSLFARGSDVPRSPVALTGMEMLGGSAGLLVLSLTTGEMARFDPGTVTAASARAFVYLCAVGCVALPVYTWLLSVAPPALVGTYAFVNPVVAVLLGWAVVGERVSPHTGLAGGLVVAGVACVTLGKSSAPVPPSPPPAPTEDPA